VRRLVILLVALAAAAPAHALAASPVSVKIDQTSVSTKIGHRFHFSTSIRNTGSQPVPGVVAHLNIMSLDPSVYVDPEDWSSSRTRYLGALEAHGSRRIDWTVQAVNSGRFVVYVAVADRNGAGTITASAPLLTHVAQRRTLNSGGVMPLALGMPAGLALILLVLRRRRRALR